MKRAKEMLINWLYEQITSLHGTRSLAYLVDMLRLLRSVRLVLHLVRRINQHFPNGRRLQRPGRLVSGEVRDGCRV
jgi:hypothetical protein